MSARPVVLAAAIASVSCGLCLESCRGDTAIPNGSGGAALTGGPALLYSMYGTESGRSERVALFNALILQPEGSPSGHSGGSYDWDCVRATETFVWSQTADSPTLKLAYDGAKRRLTVGEQEWTTSSANTFVITLDKQWQPTVRALPILVKTPAGTETLRRIQEALPGEERVKRLRVELASALSPQNNEMQLTRSATVNRWCGPCS